MFYFAILRAERESVSKNLQFSLLLPPNPKNGLMPLGYNIRVFKKGEGGGGWQVLKNWDVYCWF